jgi:FkbM family methyltransferase
MRFPVNTVAVRIGQPITGVIHVGGHHGEEYPAYVAEGVTHQIWVEPQAKQYEEMVRRIGGMPGVRCANVALGADECFTSMYTETVNGGASSSVLPPREHLTEHPHIVFDGRETVRMCRLDDLMFYREQFQMLVLDVQGYELEVLKGGTATLPYFNAIQAEIARTEVYEDCPMVEELDDFLRPFGFFRIDTFWYGANAGEGLWVC